MVQDFEDCVGLDFATKVTAPSQTPRDLGTGESAGSIQLDVFRKFGAATPFLSAGRKFIEGSRLRDRFYTTVGARLDVDASTSIGLAYD